MFLFGVEILEVKQLEFSYDFFLVNFSFEASEKFWKILD